MSNIERFKSILKVQGVDQYILVDKTGKIFVHSISEPEKMAEIVSQCGLHASAIGKTDFRYLVCLRSNPNSFFIFPVGKYYLGVIKQATVSNALLTKNILRFLKDFLNRK